MSLDIILTAPRPTHVFERNITHNLGPMAKAAGLYEVMWRPEEINVNVAADAIPLLERGLENLVADPDKYKALEPENGWGTYEGLVKFVEAYLEACQRDHRAEVNAYR